LLSKSDLAKEDPTILIVRIPGTALDYTEDFIHFSKTKFPIGRLADRDPMNSIARIQVTALNCTDNIIYSLKKFPITIFIVRILETAFNYVQAIPKKHLNKP
jgi:hypothetical protein